jgi:hypothetical protein
MKDQVMYQNRWISKNNFRAFVYGDNSQKLANSYDEYLRLIESGLWFPSREMGETAKQPTNIRKIRKPKDVPNS